MHDNANAQFTILTYIYTRFGDGNECSDKKDAEVVTKTDTI